VQLGSLFQKRLQIVLASFLMQTFRTTRTHCGNDTSRRLRRTNDPDTLHFETLTDLTLDAGEPADASAPTAVLAFHVQNIVLEREVDGHTDRDAGSCRLNP